MQDLSAKRRRLAENTVIQVGRLMEAVSALEVLSIERAQVGNFSQEEFADRSEGFDLRHLSPFLAAVTLEAAIPALLDALEEGETWGTLRAIFNQVKR
jgi:hypothetical protein